MAKKDNIEKLRKEVSKKSVSKSIQRHSGSVMDDLSLIIKTSYDSHMKSLTPKLVLIDIFLAFLVLLGVLQFAYVIMVGDFPFNAFLGGFISCVGQFVLTASLRLQIRQSKVKSNSEDETEIEDESEPFEQISPERAFGDFVFASLILHFIVFHFIN